MDTSIVNLIRDKILTTFTQELMVDVTDETQIGLVKTGRLQQDPTVHKMNVSVRQGGYGEGWDDGLRKRHDQWATPIFEIGGDDVGVSNEYWSRKFIIELDLYYTGGVNQTEGQTRTNVIISRIIHTLRHMSISTLVDDFGERGIQIVVHKPRPREGGGPPSSFIWKGDIFLEAITEMNG